MKCLTLKSLINCFLPKNKQTLHYMQKRRASTLFNLGFNIRANMGVASCAAKRALN